MQTFCIHSTEKVAQVDENSKENSKACLHDHKQIPRTNLARCYKCGGVIYRQNYDKNGKI